MFPSGNQHELDRTSSPFVKFSRRQWTAIGTQTKTETQKSWAEIEKLSTLNDPLTPQEVENIYLPLAGLLQIYAQHNQYLSKQIRSLINSEAKPPFVIGIAGSVAVGKSTTARVLKFLLAQTGKHVELITTDGYLYPNRVLAAKGLMERKGFPDSYDRQALLNLLSDIKGGAKTVQVRQYSHLLYDVLPNTITLKTPEILIVEGLNLLQPPLSGQFAISDLIDFGIYLDADVRSIALWYTERFLQLRKKVFSHPNSYFRRYSKLSRTAGIATAEKIWKTINLPNLTDNILPTRPRANLILQKDSDHKISTVYLRKI